MLTRRDKLAWLSILFVAAVFVLVGFITVLDQHWRRQDDNDRLRLQVEQEMVRCGEAWPSC